MFRRLSYVLWQQQSICQLNFWWIIRYTFGALLSCIYRTRLFSVRFMLKTPNTKNHLALRSANVENRKCNNGCSGARPQTHYFIRSFARDTIQRIHRFFISSLNGENANLFRNFRWVAVTVAAMRKFSKGSQQKFNKCQDYPLCNLLSLADSMGRQSRPINSQFKPVP